MVELERNGTSELAHFDPFADLHNSAHRILTAPAVIVGVKDNGICFIHFFLPTIVMYALTERTHSQIEFRQLMCITTPFMKEFWSLYPVLSSYYGYVFFD